MHTSTRLQASDFAFWQRCPDGLKPINFDQFWPDYHPQDRVGVVSPCLEDGVYHTAGALLVLTTRFYDNLRARASDFFDYPQHFALVGATNQVVQTHTGTLPTQTPKLWDAWSWLDVWPNNKWLTAPPSAMGMLQRAFDAQINRLLWPVNLLPRADEAPLPTYVYKMLRTSLKQVYYYDPGEVSDQAAFEMEIHGGPPVQALIQESLAYLPTPSKHALVPTLERYRPINVNDFLVALLAP